MAGKTRTGTSTPLDHTVPSFHSIHNYYFTAQNCCNMTASLHNLCILSSFFSKAREDNCHLLYNTAKRPRTGFGAMAFSALQSTPYLLQTVSTLRQRATASTTRISDLTKISNNCQRKKRFHVQLITAESSSEVGWRRKKAGESP